MGECSGLASGRWLLVVALVVALWGCAGFASSTLAPNAEAMSRHGYVPVVMPPGIQGWVKRPADTQDRTPSPVLHVYLEGDGAPWWAQRLPPADPTPLTSVAWPLAVADPHAQVAYLARPCQFLSVHARQSCPVAWWTSARWSEPVVTLTGQALDALLQASGARELVITGHSGGGTLALLVAARRQDVRCVLTVASPLDLQAWTEFHGVAAPEESLNPADVSVSSTQIATRHLFGSEDRRVPLASVGRYGERLQPDHVIVVPGQGHVQGWVNWWRASGEVQSRLFSWMKGCLKSG